MAPAKKTTAKGKQQVRPKSSDGPVSSRGPEVSRKARPPARSKTPAREKGIVTAEYEAALENRKNDLYVLRLYIAGNNLRSQMAVENVKKICEEYLRGRYELEVVDIYQDRTKNPVDLVLAAPTLIKKLPIPLRKIIGDMTRREKVLVGLDLLSHE